MGRRTGQESGKGVSPALGRGGRGRWEAGRARNGHWPGEGRVVEGRGPNGRHALSPREVGAARHLPPAGSFLAGASSSGVSLRFGGL